MSNFGISGLTKEPGASYKVEQNSFATYDKTYSGVLTGRIPFSQGETAEEHPNVVLLSLNITETGTTCNHIKIDLHYEGKDDEFTGDSGVLDISVDFTTSQEPIESHPDFVDKIGGTPDKVPGNLPPDTDPSLFTGPLHAAFFDGNTGEFLGFPVIDPSEPETFPSRFAGLKSYLMPQETYTSATVEFDYPDSLEIASIGRVFNPGLPLPELPGNRTWVNTGIRVQNIANVYYRTQRTGMLSGPRKWIPEVYGDLP